MKGPKNLASRVLTTPNDQVRALVLTYEGLEFTITQLNPALPLSQYLTAQSVQHFAKTQGRLLEKGQSANFSDHVLVTRL